MKTLKIGEVAKRSEVGIETIRFYERQGLLAEPDRRPSGYRQYDESVISRLQFIRNAKELGFTLAEIKKLIELWLDADTKCIHVRERIEQKSMELEARIQSLQKMKRSLKKIVRRCSNGDAVSECPLWVGLNELEQQSS